MSSDQSSGEDTAGPGGRKQSSGNAAAAGQRGNLTLDLDHNHNLVLSGSAGVAQPGAAANEPPDGTSENQGPPPEHDAAWYSPSARAARITQSMIEHRLRKRRVEM